ncbi:TonB family protein [Desulfocastanea catecholica]
MFQSTAMMSKEWKLPLNVAIGIHVLVLLGALYLPAMFKTKPKFADIYTVSIINIAEPAASTPPAAGPKASSPPVSSPPKKAEKPAPIIKPQEKVVKAAVPIAKTPEKPAPAPVPIAEPEAKADPVPAPQKAISLKPIKKKKIQNIKPTEESKPPENIKPRENQVRNQEIERNRRETLAKAIREEELLAAKAQLAQEALEDERNLLQTSQSASAVNKARASSSARSSASLDNQTSTAAAASGGSTNLLESQYLASVFNRLHQFWAPPEYLQQDPNLTAVVVITINLDGNIANMVFESKSGDRVFDQFVNSTIEAANPMPPIPPALRKQRFEVGLRFRPGSIQ